MPFSMLRPGKLKFTKARTKSIKLKGLEFATELSNQLLKHGSNMEALYTDLKTSLAKSKPDDDSIKALVKRAKGKMKCFEKAEVG